MIGNLWPFALVNAVDGNKADGAFTPPFVDNGVVSFAQLFVQHKVLHPDPLLAQKRGNG
jgi:hypothetical protein